jgi:hypothetical protein
MADRKELLRRYKETPRPAGVFAVRNTAEGKALVGSSVNLPGMLNRQRFQLEAGGCPIRTMQADWDRLGESAFTFEVLDTLEPPDDDPSYDPAEDLAELLGMWIDRLGLPAEKLYTR